MAQRVQNPTAVAQVVVEPRVCSPGPCSGLKDPALPEVAAAVARIQSLARGLPCTAGVATKTKSQSYNQHVISSWHLNKLSIPSGR